MPIGGQDPRARPQWFLVAMVLLWLPAPLLAESTEDAIASGVLDALSEARVENGVPALIRRRVLDRTAHRQAARIAALPEPERMSLRSPVEEDLREEGIIHFHRARTHLDLQKGARQPARGVLERWQGYGSAWEEAMAPEMDAAGAAVIRTRDGWLVFVAILVEDQDLHENPRTVERQVREAINRIREEHDLVPLRPGEEIAAVARAHSDDMVDRGFFDHVTPEGETLGDRLGRAKIPFRRAAENISLARGVKNPVETAVEEWMGSRGHRENILDPGFTHTGVGMVVAADGTIYFTQVFLTPPG